MKIAMAFFWKKVSGLIIIALPEFDKKMRKALREEIEAEEILAEREWLLNKVN